MGGKFNPTGRRACTKCGFRFRPRLSRILHSRTCTCPKCGKALPITLIPKIMKKDIEGKLYAGH